MHCNFTSIGFAFLYQIKQESKRERQTVERWSECLSPKEGKRQNLRLNYVEQTTGKKNLLISERFHSDIPSYFLSFKLYNIVYRILCFVLHLMPFGLYWKGSGLLKTKPKQQKHHQNRKRQKTQQNKNKPPSL